jgi:putative flippase GtrA
MFKIINARFIKFAIVGISGMMIDFSVTWICKEKIKINKYIANSAGFICAMFSNYLLNRYWTFESNDSHIAMQFTRFLLVSLIGLGINNLLLYLLVKNTRFNFYLLKLVVTGIVFLWNYFANLLYTFH